MVKIKMNNDGIRALQEEIAAKITTVDTDLRATPLLGHPVDEIKEKAATALGNIGVELPDGKLTEYAQSISDGNDFEFELV